MFTLIRTAVFAHKGGERIVEYKCGDAIGKRQEGEDSVEYHRRLGYEIDRVETCLLRHVDWHTHKDKYASECPICAAFVLLRGIHGDYAGMLGGDVERRDVYANTAERAGEED